ncbi:hypothetical protein HDK64DRAFT_327204 [Phyllosticta capitalensis]
MNDPSEHNQPLEVGQSFDRAIEKKINDAYEKGWDECYQARVVPLLREKAANQWSAGPGSSLLAQPPSGSSSSAPYGRSHQPLMRGEGHRVAENPRSSPPVAAGQHQSLQRRSENHSPASGLSKTISASRITGKVNSQAASDALGLVPPRQAQRRRLSNADDQGADTRDKRRRISREPRRDSESPAQIRPVQPSTQKYIQRSNKTVFRCEYHDSVNVIELADEVAIEKGGIIHKSFKIRKRDGRAIPNGLRSLEPLKSDREKARKLKDDLLNEPLCETEEKSGTSWIPVDSFKALAAKHGVSQQPEVERLGQMEGAEESIEVTGFAFVASIFASPRSTAFQ